MLPRSAIPPPVGVPDDVSAADDKLDEWANANMSPSVGLHDPRDMAVKLEPEFYTCAFVSPLRMGQKRQVYERVCGECFFALAMLFVAIIQCMTVFGMASYLVEKDKGYQDEFRLSMLMFSQDGMPLSASSSLDICGTFNQLALKHPDGSSRSLTMPDGTVYSGVQDDPPFHVYKMPSGNWVFDSIAGDESYVDKLLRVLHETEMQPARLFETISQSRIEYGTLFVVMVAILWYTVLYELRKVAKFAMCLKHLYNKGLKKGVEGTTSCDPVEGAIAIEHLNYQALTIGILCVVMRLAVVAMMLTWGTTLLAASWNKLSLVLNSLAIGIVFELDVIIAYAVVDHNTMAIIENMKPIVIRAHPWLFVNNRSAMPTVNIVFGSLMLIMVVLGTLFVRELQVDLNTRLLHQAAALCLFSGPPPQSSSGSMQLLAPVPGFCESLLSLNCAPNVTGPGSDRGPCVVTDTNLLEKRSFVLHTDDKLYDNMFDEFGQRRSMADWGKPNEKLTDSKTWVHDDNLDTFRRACLQLYQPSGKVETRIVDHDLGHAVNAAPFYCPRDVIFDPIFKGSARGFETWSKRFLLTSSNVISALDRCNRASGSRKPVHSGNHMDVSDSSASNDGDIVHALPISTLASRSVRSPATGVHLRHHHGHHERHHERHQHRLHPAARRHHLHHEVSRQVIQLGADDVN